MNKYNIKLIFSIFFTILIVIFGIYICYSIHNFMYCKNITTNSKLVTPKELDNLNKTSNLKTDAENLKNIITKNQKFIVSVYTTTNKIKGSGFLYNNKGDIITNAHLVKGTNDVIIQTSNTTLYNGTVIGRSTYFDIAVIRVPDLEGKIPTKIDNSKKINTKKDIICLGSPLNFKNNSCKRTITNIKHNFRIGEHVYKNIYEISCSVSPENTGGPIIDIKTGKIIGITLIKNKEKNIIFGIPISQITTAINNWSRNPSTILNLNIDNVDNFIKTKDLSNYAKYIVNYFYSNLNNEDYLEAYSLIGNNLKSKINYENFRKKYLSVENINIINYTITPNNNKSIKVVTKIKEKNLLNTKEYKLTHIINYKYNNFKIINISSY